MEFDESPSTTEDRRRGARAAMMALWVFVVFEAIGLSVIVWHMSGGIGSR